MTTENNNANLELGTTPVQPAKPITVNVGVPGNIRKVTLEGSNLTVKDALRVAEFSADGYEVRMGGEPVRLDSPLVDGRTILLLRPVRGNK